MYSGVELPSSFGAKSITVDLEVVIFIPATSHSVMRPSGSEVESGIFFHADNLASPRSFIDDVMQSLRDGPWFGFAALLLFRKSI